MSFCARRNRTKLIINIFFNWSQLSLLFHLPNSLCSFHLLHFLSCNLLIMAACQTSLPLGVTALYLSAFLLLLAFSYLTPSVFVRNLHVCMSLSIPNTLIVSYQHNLALTNPPPPSSTIHCILTLEICKLTDRQVFSCCSLPLGSHLGRARGWKNPLKCFEAS